MSKRKLTKQQKGRVAKLQANHREKAKTFETPTESLLETTDLGPEQQGLLLARYGRHTDVEAPDGQIYWCFLRQNLDNPVSGDQVIWRQGQHQSGIVTAIMPRKTVLSKPDRSGIAKPIAANITQVIIVIAPQPEPTMELVDRYIAACELLEFNPILVINKSDLLNEPIHALAQLYRNLGYVVIETSVIKNQAVNQLKNILVNHTSIFVGQSGVGKSSLIAAILPKEIIRVGDLSTRSQLGKHTTSTTRLYHLTQGGNIIDSPGVRQFNLWKITKEELLQGFIELKALNGQCKFRDCSHTIEPHCALVEALESGQVTQQRLDSFLKIIKNL